MSKVVTTTVLPDVAGGSLTLGGSGDNVLVTGNDFRANVLQDAGGNAVFTSNGSGVMSGMNSAFGGAWNYISTQTASNHASLTFSNMTDTYAIYCYKFINIKCQDNRVEFRFRAKNVGGLNYWAITTLWRAEHDHGDSAVSDLAYVTDHDSAASGDDPVIIAYDLGEAASEVLSGELWIFEPTSSIYVKNFYGWTQASGRTNGNDAEIRQVYVQGYVNTTTPITQMVFSMTANDMDGSIKQYGLSKS
tara:strand:- start:39 stop:779 length:741 start_codon:yes stop_codon:yes gene_type:complete